VAAALTVAVAQNRHQSRTTQDTKNKEMQRIWDAAQAYTPKNAAKIASEPKVCSCFSCSGLVLLLPMPFLM